jgi:hypothetical protein
MPSRSCNRCLSRTYHFGPRGPPVFELSRMPIEEDDTSDQEHDATVLKVKTEAPVEEHSLTAAWYGSSWLFVWLWLLLFLWMVYLGPKWYWYTEKLYKLAVVFRNIWRCCFEPENQAMTIYFIIVVYCYSFTTRDNSKEDDDVDDKSVDALNGDD